VTTRVRLCGALAVQVDGHDMTAALPGGQATALFAYELRGELAETLVAARRPDAAAEIYRSCGAEQAWLDR
jgi:hypothetical protein